MNKINKDKVFMNNMDLLNTIEEIIDKHNDLVEHIARLEKKVNHDR